mmetsp:Transcript_16196/g.48995  ORF Transcript_16196/g.48995 Transcript_16196/m.48995 type:complete len:132 (+) Transcript_16196:414-809(+)
MCVHTVLLPSAQHILLVDLPFAWLDVLPGLLLLLGIRSTANWNERTLGWAPSSSSSFGLVASSVTPQEPLPLGASLVLSVCLFALRFLESLCVIVCVCLFVARVRSPDFAALSSSFRCKVSSTNYPPMNYY